MPPIQNSYSIAGTRLHAGEYPGAKGTEEAAERLVHFLDFGVDTFIDLTESTEGLTPYAPVLERLAPPREVRRLNFPIRDVSVTNELGMQRTLDAIDGALADGRTVYVHCWGGVGRTGTVIGARRTGDAPGCRACADGGDAPGPPAVRGAALPRRDARDVMGTPPAGCRDFRDIFYS